MGLTDGTQALEAAKRRIDEVTILLAIDEPEGKGIAEVDDRVSPAQFRCL